MGSINVTMTKKVYMSQAQVKTVLICSVLIRALFTSVSWTSLNSEWALLHGNIGTITWDCLLEKTSTVVCCLGLTIWHCPCPWCSHCLEVLQPKVDKEIWPFTPLPYSPNVSLCDCWLFPELQTALKGYGFSDIVNIQGHAMTRRRTYWKRCFSCVLNNEKTNSASVLLHMETASKVTGTVSVWSDTALMGGILGT
jgi:hypothetical protein